ncbi:MAG: ATP-dependent protease peptidase subunit HslV [Bacteroidetes bacterium HLUCCA01]|nr:MAG: ATP-dependent protease peptidase subunit HslV [Bacteroidetes bacterium HLUCCA01]
MSFNLHATTVVGIIHNGKAAIGSDGQATLDKMVMKSTVQKVRTLYNGKILAGFAGSTADAFTLFEKFEEKVNQYGGNLQRAAVEMAKEWRQDRYLRRLEALLVVMNNEKGLLISGQGDVIETDDQILTIGSGGFYALAAARALKKHAPHLSSKEIIQESLTAAADIDIYTNHNITILEID